ATTINTAISTVAALNGKVKAFVLDNRIVLRAMDGSITSMVVTASVSNSAVTQIGLGASLTAQWTLEAKDLPTLYGRLTADATFNLNLDGRHGGTVPIKIMQASTATN